MTIKVKPFESLTTRELYEIMRIRAEVFVMEQNCVYLDPDRADYRSMHLFVEEGNEVVAYIRVVEPGVKYDCTSIGRFVTKQNVRGKGYGHRLLIHAIELAKSMHPHIHIVAQAYLREYYENFGFRAISDEYMYEGLPHLDMEM